MLENLRKNIRIKRQSLDYSQDYVAAKLNLTQQAYSKIENDPTSTSLQRLSEIAKVLEISLLDLLDSNSHDHLTENAVNGGQRSSLPNSIVCFSCLQGFGKQISELSVKVEHLNRALQEQLKPVQR